MESIGRYLLIIGVVILLAGAVVYLGARAGIFERIPIGRLPGDIRIQTGGLTCFFPLATSIILSIVLTIALNIIVRLINR